MTGEDSAREEAFANLLGFESKPGLEKGEATETLTTESPKPGPEKTSPAPQPRIRFLPFRLTAVDQVATGEQWQTPSPDISGNGVLTNDDRGPWDSMVKVPSFAPIVPWTRLWPRLRKAVARVRPGQIDIPRVTYRLAQGQAVRRLPRRKRLAWPDPLPVILDFSDRLTPYWNDWHWLAQHLEKHLHRQVRLYRLDGAPQRSLTAFPGELYGHKPMPWPALPPGGVLLLASDLGMGDPGHPWPRDCWQRTLGRYRKRGVKVVALAPVSARHLQFPLVNQAALVRLSPDSSLQTVPRMAETRAHLPTEHRGCSALLAMMSVATRVETGLLRALRQWVPEYGRDAGLEGEVWCRNELDTGATACAIGERDIRALRKAFEGFAPQLQRQTLACLRRWHAALPQAIHHEETLLWHRLARSAENEDSSPVRARRFFLRLKNALTLSEGSGQTPETLALKVHLADRHVSWMAPSVGKREPYLHALSAAIAELEPKRIRQGLPEGLDPIGWLKALPTREPQAVSLRQGIRLHLTIEESALSEPPVASDIRLANFNVDRTTVLWALSETDTLMVYRPWNWDGTAADNHAPVLPGLLVRPAEEPTARQQVLYIHTGQRRLRLERMLPPLWAKAWGQDTHGLYADLSVRQAKQRFRWIEPGTFLMGSPQTEPERRDRETQHEVTLSRGFWLADTACSQALWNAGTGDNPAHLKQGNNPVESVSWIDVQRFINQLNDVVPGLEARLPTEAEWEYACRAGTLTRYSFGANVTPEQVNYDGEYPYHGNPKGQYRKNTVPVKSLPANAWGLYEMHGNVWEWCADWYGGYPSTSVLDPTGPDKGSFRVLRGGSWIYYGGSLRSACRYGNDPAYRHGSIGFRLALGRGMPGLVEQEGRRVVTDRIAVAEPGNQGRHSAAGSQRRRK